MRPAADGGGVSRLSSCTAAFNDLVEERDPTLLKPLFRGFRYHLGENLAVVRPEGVPVVTPNRIPVLSWGPRLMGLSGGSSMMEATDFVKRGIGDFGVSPTQNIYSVAPLIRACWCMD